MAAAGLRRVLRGPRLSRCMSLLRVQARHCRPCGKCHNSTPSLGVQRLRLGCCRTLTQLRELHRTLTNDDRCDASPSLEWRRVFLIEVKSRLPEMPCHNTRGVRRNKKKFP